MEPGDAFYVPPGPPPARRGGDRIPPVQPRQGDGRGRAADHEEHGGDAERIAALGREAATGVKNEVRTDLGGGCNRGGNGAKRNRADSTESPAPKPRTSGDSATATDQPGGMRKPRLSGAFSGAGGTRTANFASCPILSWGRPCQRADRASRSRLEAAFRALAVARPRLPSRRGQLVDLDRFVDGVVTFGWQSLPHVSLRLLGVLGVKLR